VADRAMRIPGPDHSISIERNPSRVLVTSALGEAQERPLRGAGVETTGMSRRYEPPRQSVPERNVPSETSEIRRPGSPEQEAAENLRRDSLVVHELEHRMANTLAILQANCRLEFANIVDPALLERMRRHERRIRDLAELHHFLSRGAGHGQIGAGDYFRPLCGVLSRSILAPLGLHCEAFVSEGVLAADTCEWLGLIVTELVTNAARHGFPDHRHGRVLVRMYAPDDTAWCCTVADNGSGMQNAAGGTGSSIVDALVQKLGGRMMVDTGASGTTVTILFPAAVGSNSSVLFEKTETGGHWKAEVPATRSASVQSAELEQLAARRAGGDDTVDNHPR
jgi:two-component sensor histidine kinase